MSGLRDYHRRIGVAFRLAERHDPDMLALASEPGSYQGEAW